MRRIGGTKNMGTSSHLTGRLYLVAPSESMEQKNMFYKQTLLLPQLRPCPRPPQLKQIFSGSQHSAAAFAMRPIIISF